MKIRQYERCDCLETAEKGRVYVIGKTNITANLGGDVDSVAVFANPKTRKAVWVPYGSLVRIDKTDYFVKRGDFGKHSGDRGSQFREVYDQSVECLVDKKERTFSMEDFMGQNALAVMLNESLVSRVLHFMFDVRHHKMRGDDSVIQKWKKYDWK